MYHRYIYIYINMSIFNLDNSFFSRMYPFLLPLLGAQAIKEGEQSLTIKIIPQYDFSQVPQEWMNKGVGKLKTSQELRMLSRSLPVY